MKSTTFLALAFLSLAIPAFCDERPDWNGTFVITEVCNTQYCCCPINGTTVQTHLVEHQGQLALSFTTRVGGICAGLRELNWLAPGIEPEHNFFKSSVEVIPGVFNRYRFVRSKIGLGIFNSAHPKCEIGMITTSALQDLNSGSFEEHWKGNYVVQHKCPSTCCCPASGDAVVKFLPNGFRVETTKEGECPSSFGERFDVDFDGKRENSLHSRHFTAYSVEAGNSGNKWRIERQAGYIIAISEKRECSFWLYERGYRK